MSKIFRITSALLISILASDDATAQSKADLERQYNQTCPSGTSSENPMCPMIRNLLDKVDDSRLQNNPNRSSSIDPPSMTTPSIDDTNDLVSRQRATNAELWYAQENLRLERCQNQGGDECELIRKKIWSDLPRMTTNTPRNWQMPSHEQLKVKYASQLASFERTLAGSERPSGSRNRPSAASRTESPQSSSRNTQGNDRRGGRQSAQPQRPTGVPWNGSKNEPCITAIKTPKKPPLSETYEHNVKLTNSCNKAIDVVVCYAGSNHCTMPDVPAGGSRTTLVGSGPSPAFDAVISYR